jgi:alkanesulfonate monooxygenase SsuD/methylene tetrahydromethanopterin reductase-like flavin-dependent oxidoreductase (luciferase family)
MREFWSGETVDHRGVHFIVENARLLAAPERPIPVIVAAKGDEAARLAARCGDGLWSTSADPSVVEAYRSAGVVDRRTDS